MPENTEKTKKRFSKKWIIIALVIIGLGIGGWRLMAAKKNNSVETATVERGEVIEELILSGEVVAEKHAKLAFGSSGELSWIGVKVGDTVKQGQVVAKLDTVSLNATYQQAQSSLRQAEATVDRVHDDVKDNDTDESFTEKETRTIAEVAKDNAYESVVAARKALLNASLKAPFDGVVTYVANPFSGVSVVYGTIQVEVVNPSTMYFEVSADQTEVTGLKLGDKVSIVLDAFDKEEVSGVISYIGQTPKEGELGAVYEVRVGMSGMDLNQVKVGMTGDASFVLNKKEDVLYVPAEFVFSDKEGRYVLVDKKKVYVEVGLEGEERVEIGGDISEGQTIHD